MKGEVEVEIVLADSGVEIDAVVEVGVRITVERVWIVEVGVRITVERVWIVGAGDGMAIGGGRRERRRGGGGGGRGRVG